MPRAKRTCPQVTERAELLRGDQALSSGLCSAAGKDATHWALPWDLPGETEDARAHWLLLSTAGLFKDFHAHCESPRRRQPCKKLVTTETFLLWQDVSWYRVL